MEFSRYFLPLLVILGVSSAFAAEDFVQDTGRFEQELNERDFEALRKYLNTKRLEALEEKSVSLAISGDVRFEWRHMREKLHDFDLRGAHRKDPFTNVPVSRNDFDCEFNLKFDYIMDRSWAVAHVQYDNSAGVDSESLDCQEDPHGWFGSGRCDDFCLRKAFMGYNFWNDPCSRVDIELGRRGNLYTVFDSRIQFLSRFDGVLLKWGGKWEYISEWFIKVAGFVVDERVNHFAYIAEVGFINIMDSGIDFKYSFIDWGSHIGSRCIKRIDPDCDFKYRSNQTAKAFQFAISQWTLSYNLDPDLLCRPAKLFGAFLMNHKWKHITIRKRDKETGVVISKHKYRENLGWYAGVSIGEVDKEGDWALEIQYQVVQALAVPGQDMSGIGTGNVYDYTLTTRRRIDNTNFRGWKVEGLYALTDNITVDTIIEASRPDNPHIGGNHTYSKVEVEAIYAF